MAKPQAFTKQQHILWTELNTTIRECAGAVVSLPDTSPIRFECEQGSDLPWHLSRCGYDVRSMGLNERLMPSTIVEHRGTKSFTTQGIVPKMVGVFELELPAPPDNSGRIPW